MNKIKATTFDTTAAPVSAEEAQQLKDRIQESLVEIRQAKKWDEYMEMEDRADVEILEAKLKSSLAIINQFLATGEWSAPAGGTGETTSSATATAYGLEEGWNGPVTIRKDLPADRRGLPTDADFEGNVYIEDNNDPEQDSEVGFKLSATATDFRAYNRGRDIVYVETYKDEQGNLKKRYWIGKNHVTDVRTNIGVSAHDLDHGVTIDMSRTYRISDGSNGIEYGTPGQFAITGSDGYDTIYGSQGSDYIVGLKGNDRLYGMGGEDIIYGDDDPDWGNARAQGAFGLRSDLQDGDDIIDGGAGKDVIQGGGGLDYGFETDKLNGESTPAVEEFVENRNAVPSENSVINNVETRGWEPRSTSPGVIEIRETDTSGNSVLSLKMPAGYDMAFAEQQGNDLKITMVSNSDGGPPKTLTVIVRGALATREGSLNAPFTLKFMANNAANIIDFHNVNFANNAVVINGAENDDMILAPRNTLSEDGLTMDALLDPNNKTSRRETESVMNDIVPENSLTSDPDEWGNKVEVHFDDRKNEIVVEKRPHGGEQFVRIDPTGYDKAYAVKDGNDLLVVLVKNTGSGPETTVVRIKDYGRFSGDTQNTETLSWLILGTTEMGRFYPEGATNGYREPDTQGTMTLIPLISGTTIIGGTGNDFAFASEHDTVGHDVESSVRGRYAPGEGPGYDPNARGTGGADDTGEPEDPPNPPDAPGGNDDDAGLPS